MQVEEEGGLKATMNAMIHRYARRKEGKTISAHTLAHSIHDSPSPCLRVLVVLLYLA